MKIEDELGRVWLPELEKMMRPVLDMLSVRAYGCPGEASREAGHVGLELRVFGWKGAWESPTCK